MEILPYIHVGRSQTMEKSLMTENLEANRETKREEREVEGCVCFCVCVLSVKEEGEPIKRERDICNCEAVWLRMSGLVGCHVCD